MSSGIATNQKWTPQGQHTFEPARSKITISKSAIENNISSIRACIGETTQMWAVVKADAYGFGANQVAAVAQSVGISTFCVATMAEATALRTCVPSARIIVLNPVVTPDIDIAERDAIELVAHSADAVRRYDGRVRYHLKVNTGLNRWGSTDLPNPTNLTTAVGIMSHFAYNEPSPFTLLQYERFVSIASRYPSLQWHIANTMATLAHPRYHLDAVRIGVGIVGLYVGEFAMRWTSYLAHAHGFVAAAAAGYDQSISLSAGSVLGVIPVGYADGFLPAYVGARVMINGEPAFVRAVSMDALFVEMRSVQPPDAEVELIGPYGPQNLTAVSGLVPEAVTASLGGRPHRTDRSVSVNTSPQRRMGLVGADR